MPNDWFGGMDIGIPMLGETSKRSGKKKKSNSMFDTDIGFGFGDMSKMGIGDMGLDSGMGSGMGDMESMGGFDVEYDQPQSKNNIRRISNDNQQNEFDLFGFNQKKPAPNTPAPKVQQYKIRGIQYVQDPENPRNMIKLSTYKRRYGNTTVPKRQRRNQSGRNVSQDIAQVTNTIDSVRDKTTKIRSFVNDKMANRKYQPDAPKLKQEREVDPVRYVVAVTFDDGSQTEIITTSLVEAQTKQRSMLSDPTVRNAEITYI